jgi:hypothetical protein
MVADDQGAVSERLGYDGDFGLTRIAGQTYAASDDAMASFYRYQAQEQETFPMNCGKHNRSSAVHSS